jgi:hypothetical protein
LREKRENQQQPNQLIKAADVLRMRIRRNSALRGLPSVATKVQYCPEPRFQLSPHLSLAADWTWASNSTSWCRNPSRRHVPTQQFTSGIEDLVWN